MSSDMEQKEFKEEQLDMFASHPMDPEGFRYWVQNEAEVGDLINFCGYHIPILAFNRPDSKTGEKWPYLQPPYRSRPGLYGKHTIQRVTGYD